MNAVDARGGPTGGGRTAFVDEAMRSRPDGDGIYLLAAVAVVNDEAAELRHTLRALLLRRQLRVHWRDESQARRRKLVDIAAAAGCPAVVVMGTRMDRRRQDRARGSV